MDYWRMSNIRNNFIYNIVLNISTYVASLITFPYISRILNAESLGTIEYVSQIIQYFILFSLAGVVGIGTREIAACGDNRTKRSESFFSLLGLSSVLTLFVLLVYIVAIFVIPSFAEYKKLFLIGAAQILFTTYQIEWLYRGIENFKYITIRNIAIRVLYIVALFIFVKDESDYILWFVLTTSVIVVNSIINIVYSRHFVSFTFSFTIIKKTWGKFLKQFAILGTNNIMNSFYSTFNVVYLGMVCSKSEVGYYYVSNKIMTVCLGVISAFTLVMLPRMSNLIQTDKKEFDRVLDKSFKVVLDACIPLCIILVMYAPGIVTLLSGDGYQEAIIPLRIIAPIIFINALAQIVVYQVELPLRKDKAILTASIIGAVVGILLNFLIVKRNGVIGSAMVLCVSVLASFIYNLTYCLSHKLLHFPWQNMLKVLMSSIPYVLLWAVLHFVIDNVYLNLGIGCGISWIYWMILNKEIWMTFVKSYFKTK